MLSVNWLSWVLSLLSRSVAVTVILLIAGCNQSDPVGSQPESLDLAVANAGSYDVSILLGNGDGTFAAGATVPAGNDPQSVVVGEFN